MNREEKVQSLQETFRTSGWRDIIIPALNRMIADIEFAWINNQRPEALKGLEDEALKQRAWAFAWMREWPDRVDNLLEQLRTEDRLRDSTEKHGEGGSPY